VSPRRPSFIAVPCERQVAVAADYRFDPIASKIDASTGEFEDGARDATTCSSVDRSDRGALGPIHAIAVRVIP
jgi:hypothetical protein